MKGLIAGLLAIPLAGIFLVMGAGSSNACGGAAIRVTDSSTIANVAGYTVDQLTVAADIVNFGANSNVTSQAQTMAIMLAIAQEQLSGATSPEAAYDLVTSVSGWTAMKPGLLIHSILGGEDPLAFDELWTDAATIMATFSSMSLDCALSAPGAVSPTGWAIPSEGPVSSSYGPRNLSCNSSGCPSTFHRGVDLAPGCGKPIYAARGGTVVAAGPAAGYGGWILIDHGGRIATGYAHMYVSEIFVRVGEQVSAGQNIAKIGSSGVSTGCHLHFEVRLDGRQVDPEVFMEAVGLTLG